MHTGNGVGSVHLCIQWHTFIRHRYYTSDFTDFYSRHFSIMGIWMPKNVFKSLNKVDLKMI